MNGLNGTTCLNNEHGEDDLRGTGGGTVRDWLSGQSFADQYEFGMDVLRRIENGLPLP